MPHNVTFEGFPKRYWSHRIFIARSLHAQGWTRSVPQYRRSWRLPRNMRDRIKRINSDWNHRQFYSAHQPRGFPEATEMPRGYSPALEGAEDKRARSQFKARSANAQLMCNRDSDPEYLKSGPNHPRAFGDVPETRGTPRRAAEVPIDTSLAMSRPGDVRDDEKKQRGISGAGEMAEATPAAQPHSIANAALVARGSIKSGYLWKMGANVPRWKRRFFVLKPITMLFYYLTEHDTEPRGCIDLDLFDAVRKVRDDGESSSNHGSSAATAAAAAPASSKPKSTNTSFELYRSGCPDGSGFMLEARGGEDWEHWVESIANGRHGKIQAEMDVVKGANKLLLEEISGLEQQVATFRGYADQRHVTVLALRDERQRSREIVSELVTLGDTAAAISHLVSTGVYTHEQKHQRQQQPQHQQHPRCESRPAGGDAAASSSLGSTNSKKTSGSSLFSGHGVGAGQAQRTFVASATSSEMLMASPSGTLSASGHGERITKISPGAGTPAAQHNNNIYQGPEEEVPEGEKHSLKAIRKALSDALAELDRRGEALKAERGAKSEVEGRIREAENVARAAEERGLAAEANVGKLKGRISVLERNVEYLQSQERGLRAELCQAQLKAQVVRAQKAVLKKEVREMWSKQSPLSRGPSSRSPPAPPMTIPSQQQVKITRSRARTWASMGNLVEVDIPADSREESSCAEEVASQDREVSALASKARATTSSHADVSENAVGSGAAGGSEQGSSRHRRSGNKMRMSVSGESLHASVSDGGDTDFADLTASEASDEEDEAERNGNNARSYGTSSHEAATNRFRDRVRRTIRKRVGDPQVPPLPPSRHIRVLSASKRPPPYNAGLASGPSEPAGGAAQGDLAISAAGECSGLGGTTSLGMAAGLFLGLRKGMVDKAAQEMGKKLLLWPGNMPSVSSFGSIAAGAIVQQHPHTPVGSPRSATASFSAALTDSPVRWTSSSSHGSNVSAAAGPSGPGMAGESDDSASAQTATPSSSSNSQQQPMQSTAAAAAGAKQGAVGSGGGGSASAVLPRAASALSRTALIQLSDLELAEPCVTRIAGAAKGLNCPDAGLGGTGAVTPVDEENGEMASKRRFLPPRPVDEYELLFTTRVIGLQFKELPDSKVVYVHGKDGFVGPTPSGFPGEKLSPDIGDVLESYNGVSAHGKSADVVARELGQCGRPLRLGFRSAQAEVAGGGIDIDAGAWAFDESWHEGGRSGDGNSIPSKIDHQRSSANDSWGVRHKAGGSSCRDAVALLTPLHSRTVSS